MTHFAGNRYPLVIFAAPVSHPPRLRHSSSNSGPAARWIAPSTPPPPSNEAFAAFTMASTRNRVMSVFSAVIRFLMDMQKLSLKIAATAPRKQDFHWFMVRFAARVSDVHRYQGHCE